MSPAYHDSLNLSYKPTLNIQVKWLSSCRVNVYAPKHHLPHSESLMSTEGGSHAKTEKAQESRPSSCLSEVTLPISG